MPTVLFRAREAACRRRKQGGYKTYFKWPLGEADCALPNAQGYNVMKCAFLYHLNAYT